MVNDLNIQTFCMFVPQKFVVCQKVLFYLRQHDLKSHFHNFRKCLLVRFKSASVCLMSMGAFARISMSVCVAFVYVC